MEEELQQEELQVDPSLIGPTGNVEQVKSESSGSPVKETRIEENVVITKTSKRSLSKASVLSRKRKLDEKKKTEKEKGEVKKEDMSDCEEDEEDIWQEVTGKFLFGKLK